MAFRRNLRYYYMGCYKLILVCLPDHAGIASCASTRCITGLSCVSTKRLYYALYLKTVRFIERETRCITGLSCVSTKRLYYALYLKTVRFIERGILWNQPGLHLQKSTRAEKKRRR